MSPSWYAWLLARSDSPADTSRAPSTENSSSTSAALTGIPVPALSWHVACLVDATGALRAAKPKSRLARSRPSKSCFVLFFRGDVHLLNVKSAQEKF